MKFDERYQTIVERWEDKEYINTFNIFCREHMMSGTIRAKKVLGVGQVHLHLAVHPVDQPRAVVLIIHGFISLMLVAY